MYKFNSTNTCCYCSSRWPELYQWTIVLKLITAIFCYFILGAQMLLLLTHKPQLLVTNDPLLQV